MCAIFTTLNFPVASWFNFYPNMPPRTRRRLAYFDRCVGSYDESKLDSFQNALFKLLRENVFDSSTGNFISETGCRFMKKANATGPRAASFAIPRSLSHAMSHILKVDKPITSPQNRRFLAAGKDADDLKARLEKLGKGMKDCTKLYEQMAWHKEADRGVVIILQGVDEESKRHMWSCADKPPKQDDGLFFKEPNVKGVTWTLRELADDIDACSGLCALIFSLE